MAGAANRGDGSYYADECHNETLIRAVSEVRPPPLNTPNRPDAKQTQPKPDGHQFAPTHDGIRQREESADRKSVTDRSTRNSCKRRSHLHTDVAYRRVSDVVAWRLGDAVLFRAMVPSFSTGFFVVVVVVFFWLFSAWLLSRRATRAFLFLFFCFFVFFSGSRCRRRRFRRFSF